MKITRTLLFLAFLPLMFMSCSDDELLSEQILGRWNFSYYETTDCENNSIGNVMLDPDENNCVTIDGRTSCNINLVFNSDGTAVESFTLDGTILTEEYTYTVDDETETILLCEDTDDCLEINIDGDQLTRILPDSDCTIRVEYTRN